MTRAETLLWRHPKAGRLDEVSFRRQTPIGSYIVDYVCHAGGIVVEIDGETRDFETRLQTSARRGQ